MKLQEQNGISQRMRTTTSQLYVDLSDWIQYPPDGVRQSHLAVDLSRTFQNWSTNPRATTKTKL